MEEMRKKSLRFVTPKEGGETGTQIGARKYLECSSLTGEGVDDVFEAATRAALLTFEKRKTPCCIVLWRIAKDKSLLFSNIYLRWFLIMRRAEAKIRTVDSVSWSILHYRRLGGFFRFDWTFVSSFFSASTATWSFDLTVLFWRFLIPLSHDICGHSFYLTICVRALVFTLLIRLVLFSGSNSIRICFGHEYVDFWTCLWNLLCVYF